MSRILLLPNHIQYTHIDIIIKISNWIDIALQQTNDYKGNDTYKLFFRQMEPYLLEVFKMPYINTIFPPEILSHVKNQFLFPSNCKIRVKRREKKKLSKRLAKTAQV